MPETVTERKMKDLEERVETLELIMDQKLREKIEKGLKDEKEGKVVSLEEYEDREAT